MSGPLFEIQKGIFDKLKADATLVALLGGSIPANTKVYDSPPENATFPYVVIGDKTTGDFAAMTFRGQEQTVTIHSWSQAKSSGQVQNIMDRLWSLLHEGTLTLTGHTLVLMRHEFGQPILDEDGRTHHGVQRFRILMKEG
jgi:hypothetical protein